MKVVAVGDRPFVTALRLAGIEGVEVERAEDLPSTINRLLGRKDISLIVVSSNMASKHRKYLANLRRKLSLPVIYELASPVGTTESVDYKSLLRELLGV
jgi:vacuolar-type H+-ATPase subunit F/Vma7